MSSNDFTLIRGLPLCSFTQPLDLRGLAAGAYLVRVTDHTGAFGMTRLVKQ